MFLLWGSAGGAAESRNVEYKCTHLRRTQCGQNGRAWLRRERRKTTDGAGKQPMGRRLFSDVRVSVAARPWRLTVISAPARGRGEIFGNIHFGDGFCLVTRGHLCQAILEF